MGKKPELSIHEKLELLDALRKKYREAAEKYGKKYFNVSDLESRIQALLQSKGSILLFLEHEKEFYETLKAKALADLEEEKKRQEFHEKAAKIMRENLEKIQKYPKLTFSQAATEEIMHFVGAITEFMNRYHNILTFLFRGKPEWKEMSGAFAELERFHIPPDGVATPLLKYYEEEIQGKSIEQMEKLDRQIMQTGGLAIYRLLLELDKLVKSLPEEEKKNFIQFYTHDRTPFTAEEKEYYRSRRVMDIINEARFFLQGILEDFRIEDLVKHAYRS
ncbi:MAG: hypothetical protein D6767_09015 [Candidatus Hydrogenedentota bacterium]|nr:MAG: hypothetical protein D6767_09015 [Candidatus Hydrogenedentota bacterium]